MSIDRLGAMDGAYPDLVVYSLFPPLVAPFSLPKISAADSRTIASQPSKKVS